MPRFNQGCFFFGRLEFGLLRSAGDRRRLPGSRRVTKPAELLLVASLLTLLFPLSLAADERPPTPQSCSHCRSRQVCACQDHTPTASDRALDSAVLDLSVFGLPKSDPERFFFPPVHTEPSTTFGDQIPGHLTLESGKSKNPVRSDWGPAASSTRNLLEPGDPAKIVVELMQHIGEGALEGTIFQSPSGNDAPENERAGRGLPNEDRDVVIRYLRRIQQDSDHLENVRPSAVELPIYQQPFADQDDSAADFARTLRDAAIQLEQAASDLEERAAYRLADQLRYSAAELRSHARLATTDSAGRTRR